MEEVEKHLLETFSRLDCSFAEELESFESLTTENCIEFLIRCLWDIKPTTRNQISSFKLPPNITARFRIATTIAECLKECGVRAQFGYQTLLYGSHAEMRRIFLAVIEQLPKDGVAINDYTLSARDTVLATTSAQLSEKHLWVPEFCRRMKMKHDGRFWYPTMEDPEYASPFTDKDFWSALEAGGDSRTWIAALMRLNNMGVSSSSDVPSSDDIRAAQRSRQKPQLAPKPITKPALPPKPKHLEVNESERSSLEEKSEKVAQLRNEVESRRMDVVQWRCGQVLLEDKISQLKAKIACKDDKWLSLLENPEEGRTKLQGYLEDSADRLERLESKWLSAMAERIEERTRLKNARGVAGEVERMRSKKLANVQKKSELEEDLVAKEILEKKLTKRLGKVGDDKFNRPQYTKRIFEILQNVKKQQEEIDKINGENLTIHKEINWSSQALERSFAIIEDALYRDTDKSYKAEKAYKLFSRVHTTCAQAVQSIEKAGTLTRKIEDLTDQIEIEKQSTVDTQLQRILNDMIEIQEDSKRLQKVLDELN